LETIPESTLFIALIVLLAISGFFSLSETSMVALNRYRLKHLVQSGHRGAKLASQLLARTDKFLGMVLFGNNLLNVASALVVGEIAARYLGNSQATLLVATAVATFAILVFSEITPKVLGATYPERVALPASYLLTPLLRIAQPVVWFVNLFVQGVLWILRLRPTENAGEHKLSVEELRTLVLETGYLPQKHQSILLNLFDLEAITVDDIMVPRNQIEAIDLDGPLDDSRQQIATAHHRRLLVYRGRLDEVVGTLRVRSVLNLVQNEELTKERLREIIREPSFVPVGTPLFSQLQNFQEEQDRVSLVVDEYGELMGLVTMEDILEEIIGEFTTQSPLQTRGFAKQADGSILVEGSTLLRDLNRKLGFGFPLDGPKTLNGLIVEYLQDIPEPNTSVKIAGHPLEIVQTQDRVVKAVRIVPSGLSEGRPGAPPGEK
jgi:Mg2+/Co2+ transporter CorB